MINERRILFYQFRLVQAEKATDEARKLFGHHSTETTAKLLSDFATEENKCRFDLLFLEMKG